MIPVVIHPRYILYYDSRRLGAGKSRCVTERIAHVSNNEITSSLISLSSFVPFLYQVDIMADIETGTAPPPALDLPPEPESKAGLLKPVPETTIVERIFIGIALVTVTTSLAAMIVTLGNIVIVIAGVFSIILSPYAYYQQTQLTDIRTLKETTEVVEREVNRLKSENDRLGTNIDTLGTTIDELKDVESALQVLSGQQGQSIDAFEKQVEENRKLLQNMQKSTKGRVIQNLIDIVYRGDQDMDNVISPEETDRVIAGLKRLGDVVVKEDKLRAAIQGKSVEAVIDVTQNLMDDNIPQEERIFDIIDM